MAKRLDEQSERRRGLAPAGIIEVIAGIGRAPILEHALQAALRDMGRCDILRHIGQTEPGQRRVDFTSQMLSIELDRPRDNLVSVTFAMAATEFAKASQVVKILVARSSLPDARAA